MGGLLPKLPQNADFIKFLAFPRIGKIASYLLLGKGGLFIRNTILPFAFKNKVVPDSQTGIPQPQTFNTLKELDGIQTIGQLQWVN